MRKILTFLAVCMAVFGSSNDDMRGCITKGEAASCEKFLTNLQKECNKGDLLKCYYLGDYYAKGYDGYKDLIKAFEVFNATCDKGSAESCYEASVFYLKGEGAEFSFEKSAERLNKACKFGSKRACNVLEYVPR
ncbi:sel1 repeat family protein [Campylobacter sp. faydin G-24]|uniref:beta-lactamase n=1 Tax=Campylobacter anatolicus TaxID=2829105 RepID=A0ABS5HLG6_9BACT|nr:sel1 repeat family protein [Campylobacter anatolicus]MBR8464527.1 sel1 repeat family protein [Campylobacter anatolicus]MBR8466260.1 sel1 repeat family protein [Campylobacter anatolicus]